MSDKIKRCCRNCVFINYEKAMPTCYEGGMTEIGDPDRELTAEECNAWKASEAAEIFGNVISAYSSAQAEEDGMLVKVKDDVINYMTNGVWGKCIEPFVIKDDDGKPTKIPGMRNTYQDMVRKLVMRVKVAMVQQIQAGKAKAGDWFYKVEVSGWTFFIEQNETGRFTILFPEEH
jgi:hypothetical protein